MQIETSGIAVEHWPVEHWTAHQWLIAAGLSEARGDYAEAFAGYTNALRLDPMNLDGMECLARIHERSGDREGAITWLHQAIAASRGQLKFQLLLAAQLECDRQLDAAVELLTGLQAQHPDDPRVLAALGSSLLLRGELADGEALLRRAVELAPDSAPVRTQYAIGLWRLHRWDHALAQLEHAERDQPDNLHTRFVKSHLLLELGDYHRGYADRESFDAHYPPRLRERAWMGETLAGKQLLVYAQHGLGDTLQYVRYVDTLQRLGAIVTLMVQPPLLPLLRNIAGAARVLTLVDPVPAHDLQVRLMDIPGILGHAVDEVPREIPYLHAEPQRIRQQLTRLQSFARPWVGICWQGNPRQKDGLIRSCELATLARVGEAGATLISLQRGVDSRELAAHGVVDIPELDADAPFLDTAALIQCLDLVISVDTSVAHVAGALGAKVWMLLPYWSDWRWMIERTDTPWYPTMRLFRQDRPHSWDSVIHRVTRELSDLVARSK
ncbi:MAG TPA: tetratricopeptide repeat protein [Enhygromyxa sp.]|nr:tetratricopeptide repeat protein [Enhygromyxa sp.]